MRTYRRRTFARAGLALTLAVALAACGTEAESTPTDEPAEPAGSPAAGLSEQELDRLAMLGYAEFAERAAPESEGVGVVVNDPYRTMGGYVLVSHITTNSADLIDASGAILHSWTFPGIDRLVRARIATNGDLLAITADEPRAARGKKPGVSDKPLSVRRLTSDGAERWRLRARYHHDVRELPTGEVIVLDTVTRDQDRGRPARFRDDVLVLLSSEGEILERRSLYSVLVRHDRGSLLPPAPIRGDVFHTNSFVWIDRDDLPEEHPFSNGPVALISMRELDLVVAFRWETNEVVWSWGPGEVLGQHEAVLDAEGHVRLFDNGDTTRPYSRVLVVDPRDNSIVWAWTAPDPRDVFSLTRGQVQPLPNGNTLVVVSDAGEILELTPEGDMVWRWITPATNEDGRRAALRADWTPPARVEAALSAAADDR